MITLPGVLCPLMAGSVKKSRIGEDEAAGCEVGDAVSLADGTEDGIADAAEPV
jgi:hypothetical protein